MTTITTSSPLLPATLSKNYTTTFTTTGGVPPYSYSVIGALPAGLALSASGVLSGVSTGPVGSFTFDVRVTGSNSVQSTKTFSLDVLASYQITSNTQFLPSAGVGEVYQQTISVQGGLAPYSFSLVSGTLPPGLSLDSEGVVSGVTSAIGLYSFSVLVRDSNLVTTTLSFRVSVINFVNLSDITVDHGQFAQQLQDNLSGRPAWSSNLTTQTSQTLIELVAAIGTFETAKIIRAREDSFAETAQSDSSIRAIANMQGLRLSRKLPATVSVSLVSPSSISIPAYTQFSGAGYNWFNTEVINLTAGVARNGITLKEGTLITNNISGRGTDLQAWVSPEDGFQVSDQDVLVSINGATTSKSFGGLWNFRGQDAFADSTLSDGRLLIQFGSNGYGAVPGVNDAVTIKYAVTAGASVNGAATTGTKATVADFPSVSGTFQASPAGGADEKSPLAYKNFASGTFGTYGSGVTKAQYQALVNNYPGIIDAVTQSQREINPSALAWMNIIRVSALTNSPWSQAQVEDFISYMESVTMFTPKFVWQQATPIPRNIDISVYCFNSVSSLSTVGAAVKAAIQKLFSPRQGLLMTNFYNSDLVETAMDAAPGQVSYVLVNSPTQPMIVTSPPSPTASFSLATGGTLTPQVYTYSISVDVNNNGVLDVGNPTSWIYPQVFDNGSSITLEWSNDDTQNVVNYHVWGRRAGVIGKLATLGPDVKTFTDTGSVNPTPTPINVSDVFIRYNSIASLTVNTFYAGRQSKATFPVRETI